MESDKVAAYINARFPRASSYEATKLTADWVTKERAAEGIFSDFTKRAGDPRGKKVLDIGFGNGAILAQFAKRGSNAYGIETDESLLIIARENLSKYRISAEVILYDGKIFPFEDNFFDYIYATSVLEHVDNPAATLAEAYRVLKPGGRFYVSFPNRLWPRETHTGVWFLNYIPIRTARILFKLIKKTSIEDLNLHFLSYWSLTRAIYKSGARFHIIFETENPSPFKRILKKFLAVLGIHHSAILRTVMVIMEKS
jgi:SAM-dependent methyltransferase